MKPFAEYSDNERADWREQDITIAFIGLLRSEIEHAQDNCLSAVRSSEIDLASRWVGSLDAYKTALDIAIRSFEK
jgi:hypothetical protein